MCIALKPEGQQCCSIMKFSGIEEGREGREGAKDLFLCQVNILPSHNSQNGTLYTKHNAVATLHKPSELKGGDKSVRNPFPGCSNICHR